MKKTILTLILMILTVLCTVLPAFADAIIPDELLEDPVEEPEKENKPAESAENATTAADSPDPNAGRQNGPVDSNAKSVSLPVVACAVGVLLLAVAALIRAVLQNRREAKKDKEIT